jgi:hypothetical protein
MLNIYIKSLLGGIAAELVYITAILLGRQFGVGETLMVIVLAILICLSLYIHWSKTENRAILYIYLVGVTGFMLSLLSLPILAGIAKLGTYAANSAACMVDPVTDALTCAPIINFFLSYPLYIIAFVILPIVGAILTFINLKTWFGRIAPHTVDPVLR